MTTTPGAAVLLGLVDEEPRKVAPAPTPSPDTSRKHRPRYRRNKHRHEPNSFEREPDGQDATPIFGPGERIKALKIHL